MKENDGLVKRAKGYIRLRLAGNAKRRKQLQSTFIWSEVMSNVGLLEKTSGRCIKLRPTNNAKGRK